MRPQIIAFTIILFLFGPMAQSLVAQTFTAVTDVEPLKKKLKETSEATKSIECEFTQVKKMSILQEDAISKGKFYYQESNKVRWEIITPESYIVIINGFKMMVKDKSKVKTYDTKTHKMFGKINEIMMATIKGSFGEDDSEYKEEYFESKDFYMLKLIPMEKGSQKYLSSIEMYFDKKKYDVLKIKMNEPGGDNTELSFFNKTLNGPIDAKVFELSK
jgi:outer membrane lipoprotein-sorting protein